MAKINLKANAKISLKFEETKKAENNKLRAQGVDIDTNLRRGMVEAIALRLVERINSLTAIRVLAGTKNSRPVGFYSGNSTKSTVNPNTTIPQI